MIEDCHTSHLLNSKIFRIKIIFTGVPKDDRHPERERDFRQKGST